MKNISVLFLSSSLMLGGCASDPKIWKGESGVEIRVHPEQNLEEASKAIQSELDHRWLTGGKAIKEDDRQAVAQMVRENQSQIHSYKIGAIKRISERLNILQALSESKFSKTSETDTNHKSLKLIRDAYQDLNRDWNILKINADARSGSTEEREFTQAAERILIKKELCLATKTPGYQKLTVRGASSLYGGGDAHKMEIIEGGTNPFALTVAADPGICRVVLDVAEVAGAFEASQRIKEDKKVGTLTTETLPIPYLVPTHE